jgi:hypothetical protein
MMVSQSQQHAGVKSKYVAHWIHVCCDGLHQVCSTFYVVWATSAKFCLLMGNMKF